MMTFVTLLLGVAFGTHPVQVAVSGDVSRVELRLDGQPVATLDGEPWTADCDLGHELAPHVLSAVAFDRSGLPVAQEEQWINVPHAQAELRILVEPGEGARPPVARLYWSTLEQVQPRDLTVTFDHEPVAFTDPHAVALPAHDPSTLHFVTAEGTFSNELMVRSVVALGGVFGEAVSSELTAVPVYVQRRRDRLPPARDMAGWFRSSRGEPLRIFTTENVGGDILVVIDESQRKSFDRQLRLVRGLRGPVATIGGLGKDDRVWRVRTVPEIHKKNGIPTALFPRSKNLSTSRTKTLVNTLEKVWLPQDGQSYLATAVASAGLTAAAGNRPRAVLLVLGEELEDPSPLSPASVRRYLQRLHVPLFVWSVTGELSDDHPWAGAEDVSSSVKLLEAGKEVMDDLARQRVVWLEGRHLPTDIRLNHDEVVLVGGEI